MRKHEAAPEVAAPEVARPGSAPASPGHAEQLLRLQRVAGNAAVVASLRPAPSPAEPQAGGRSSVVHRLLQRRVAKETTDPDSGPIADIEDSTLSGARKKAADQALGYIDGGTALLEQPWVKAKVKANGDKVPNSVKKVKWGDSHKNRDGDLPGKKNAGGYKEYYLRTGDTDGDPISPTDRLVISDSSKQVFHTSTHYGRDGKPAFTHLR